MQISREYRLGLQDPNRMVAKLEAKRRKQKKKD
jgi:hypothetical protein